MKTGLTLWNEQPLVVNVQVARVIGLEETIVLQQVHYWCQLNRRADRNRKDGHYWVYNSYADWQLQFPFWCLRTVNSIFARLIKQGYLVTGNFNKDIRDRTKWYRVNEKAFDDFNDSPIVHLAQVKRGKIVGIFNEGKFSSVDKPIAVVNEEEV